MNEILDRTAALCVKKVLEAFPEFLTAYSDDARAAIIRKLGEHCCLDCGSLYLPCYCLRDE